MASPYQELSQIYDKRWGFFANSYFRLVKELFRESFFRPRRILDVACGTGVLALKLAQEGFFVVGIDSSPEMISLAQAKVKPGLSLSFEVQDMKELKVEEPFDFIFCTFDSINYLLSESEIAHFLLRVNSALKWNGFFMFDSVTEVLCNKHYGERWRKVGRVKFLEKFSYYPRRKIAITTFQFKDGSEEIHLQKPYGLRELAPLLCNSGFIICDKFSSPEGESYRPGSERLVCITRKKGCL